MLLSRFNLSVVIGIACVVGATSEAFSADEVATVESVIARYIKSQGGVEKLGTLFTLKIEGEISIESQGLAFPVTQWVVTPDKSYVEQDFPTLGIIREVINGSIGWEWHPITGERPLDDEEIEDKLKETDLQRDLKLFDVYQKISFGDPEVIEGHETTHLIFVDDKRKEEHWYFLENGDLFQKIHTVTSGPESEFETIDRFYDFETFDGFRYPSRIKSINPAYVAQLVITSCQINAAIEPSVFVLPEPIIK